MVSLGEQLRDARVAKNKSLGDVSNDTNISIKYLKALEENDYDTFPAQVYTRGFLKAYAKFLGLNPQAILEEYNKLTIRDKLLDKDAPEKDLPKPREQKTSRKRVVIPVIVLLFAVLCILAFLWYYYLYR